MISHQSPHSSIPHPYHRRVLFCSSLQASPKYSLGVCLRSGIPARRSGLVPNPGARLSDTPLETEINPNSQARRDKIKYRRGNRQSPGAEKSPNFKYALEKTGVRGITVRSILFRGYISRLLSLIPSPNIDPNFFHLQKPINTLTAPNLIYLLDTLLPTPLFQVFDSGSQIFKKSSRVTPNIPLTTGE